MIRRLPRNLRDMFKAKCSSRGVPMKTAFMQFMKAVISEEVDLHGFSLAGKRVK